MKKFKHPLQIEQICSILSGKYIRRFDTQIKNVTELGEATDNSICFFENPKYIEQVKNSQAGLIIAPADFDISQNSYSNLLLIDSPYFNFMKLISYVLEMERDKKGVIASSAVILENVNLGKQVSIGENVVIHKNVHIGDNTVIEANTVIGENAEIGQNCHFYPNSTIYEDTIIGDKVIIHSNSVIGADGFGYFFKENRQQKIPQIGNVIIESDVEIGAGTTIDRATIGSTIIGKGTKIDNLVQIGHNCKIGEHSIICAQVGLAGNTEVGNMVFLAGQVGAAGHLKIGDGSLVGAQSGVAKSLPAGGKYFGTPAIEAGLQKKIIVSEKKLPGFFKEWKLYKKGKLLG